MTRLMRDSTTAGDIPLPGTQLAGGYSNGQYQWSPADWARFPHSAHASIDVMGTDPHADALDVETGDATVPAAVSWVRAKLALHPAYVPLIYCNRATLTPLFNAMNADGLQIVKHFRLWVATLDGTKALGDMTGVTAIQFAGQAQTGGHWDDSLGFDAAWKAPVPPPPPPAWITQAVTQAESLTALLKTHAVPQAVTLAESLTALLKSHAV